MSRRVAIKNLTHDFITKIERDLYIQPEPSKYAPLLQPPPIQAYEMDGKDHVLIPFAYERSFPRPSRDLFTKTQYHFEGKLRPEQHKVKTEAIEHLNKYGSTIIACYPGYGKTITSIYIASKIKLRTMVIVHRIVLINQWKDSIMKFCPDARVQILEPNDTMEDADFYIMNAVNVPKNPRGFYRSIAFVIVDESHLIMAQQLSQCMFYFSPRYVLGLSATPYRTDGLNILFRFYFGKKKIERKLWHPHTVYVIESGITPEVEIAKNGKVNWGSVLNSQCNNVNRNELIVRLVQFFPDRVFLILCKRVAQAKYLVQRLKEEGEDVTSLIGSQQHYGHDSRVLVASTSKAGVGFDHPRLNALILASDIEQYFVQFLGRIFRTEKVHPMIIDIVDNNPILKKHYVTRRSVYIEHGGTIKNFSQTFPKFSLK